MQGVKVGCRRGGYGGLQESGLCLWGRIGGYGMRQKRG